MDFNLKPIGVIHSPYIQPDGMPIQSIRSTARGFIELFPDYVEGLEGVEEFSHLILLYIFHKSPPLTTLKVKPFLDDLFHGVFATRYPVRPNPLGLSVVQLLERKENRLEFLGADMLDGTPLLDIKPYVPDFDIHSVSRIGWFANRTRQ
jgi:tRNA-Thr(GGU) m(6)t(6)A37 methyltransferase TsaA